MILFMANNTISQIKLNGVTYDICDYAARQKLLLWKMINKTVASPITVPANYINHCTWQESTPSDYEYWGYKDYNLTSIYATPLTFTEGGMAFGNVKSSAITIDPYATLIYMTSTLDV